MTLKPGWDWVSPDMEAKALETIIASMSAGAILQIPGVYELVKEEYNNEMLKDLAEDAECCHMCGAKLTKDTGECLKCDLGWKVEDIEKLEKLLNEQKQLLAPSLLLTPLEQQRLDAIAEELKELGWEED
jgi:uncharacterized paraquat-inducible protein A